MKSAIINAIRGALIGVAEAIPGVSGGTVALIVGVYHSLLAAGADAVLVVRKRLGLARKHPEAVRLRDLPWGLLIPLGIGMLVALLAGARVIEPLLEEYPAQMRAVFFGLVLGGVYVPAHMVISQGGRWRFVDIIEATLAAALLFLLTGLPPGEITDPGPLLIAGSAAVAVCALVLPGVSGSFFLLTIGMYAPTIAAVNDRNLAYVAIFATGAILGLALFVPFLRWVLDNHARITLVIITGLMIGSLRALWPWQDAETRELMAPTTDVAMLVGLILAGVLIVAILLRIEARLGLTEEQEDAGKLHG